MGLIKEYVDREVQTETDPLPSPYADPAVVLAAPAVPRRGRIQDSPPAVSSESQSSTSAPSPAPSDGAQSPTSPMLAPLVSRRLPKRKHLQSRSPAGDNRRIVSMPENKSQDSASLYLNHGKRVVSMPDRVRPVLEPSVELFQSPATGDSFGSYSGRRERVRIFRVPSDVPQTPSPPSSPESLLIIAAGTQFPEGFLRRKYSPEPLIEEDEDWITWANSPPRPIPALHGPLSLPYARCPSGAEGTIIEEPDNVAQMIWGLGPDDQPHSQVRAEGISSHSDTSQKAPSHGPNHVPPRSQKKRTPIPPQTSKSSRAPISAHASHGNSSNIARTQRHIYDKRSSVNHVSPDIESRQDTISGLPWIEGQSMSTSVGGPDNLMNDVDVFPVDNNRMLEWQLARLRQALRTSLADMDSYNTYPGGLEPVIPAAVASGLPQSYPRIFVEPRPNESVGAVARQSPAEIAQRYRQQQLYRQALQKPKLQVQNVLPTPPNSSSPQWSSHFSPYLTYCSTFSPDMVGSPDHSIAVPSPKYRSSANASQYLRRVHDRHDVDHVSNFDMRTNISSSSKTPQVVPNVNLSASSSSSTLAKYIQQLQALSPIAQFSSVQPVPPPNVPLPPLPSTDEDALGPFPDAYHSPVVPAPPSPESPQNRFRGASYQNARSIPPTRLMQRRLSSVPEEDSALLELSTSISPSRLQSYVAVERQHSVLSSHEGLTGNHSHYLEVPVVDVGIMQKTPLPDLAELESNLGTSPIAFHETSPVKVRLPVTKEHNMREQSSGYHEQNRGNPHGHRKKHRYKKLKGPGGTNEQVHARGLVG